MINVGIYSVGPKFYKNSNIQYVHPAFYYPWEDYGYNIIKIDDPTKINKIDLYYHLGYHESKEHLQYLEYAIEKNMFVVVHWLGFDVYRLTQKLFKPINGIGCHFSQSKLNQKELMFFNIKSTINTHVPQKGMFFLSNLGNCISVHMPNKSDFYCYNLIKKVVTILSNETFIFYSSRACFDDLPDNCKIYQTTHDTSSIVNIIKDSKAHLRLSKHEGFPHSIIQHKMMGREVITNHSFPLCTKVDLEVDSIIKAIKNIQDYSDRDGSQYYINNYSPDLFISKFNSVINSSR